MQLVAIPLSVTARRRGWVVLAHEDVDLMRVLVPGEAVLVQDTATAATAQATVTRVDPVQGDIIYELQLDEPGESVPDRIGGRRQAVDLLTVLDVISLVEELRLGITAGHDEPTDVPLIPAEA